jgi:short-subunit dehydrogenase
MKDKCILVTGSSSGIGFSITKKLLNCGAKVIGIARNHSKFSIDHPNYVTYDVEMSDLNNLNKIMNKIIKENNEITGLISNAGYGEFGPLENFSIEQISSFISVNLTSHIVVTKLILPHLKKRKMGDIIFIGSEAGLLGSKNGSLYCTAKFGLRGFSQSIRHDTSTSNIRVCIINPGMVRTEFFKNLKFSPGDDVDNAINSDDIANAVINVIKLEQSTVVDEINLSPLKKVVKFN